MPKQKSKNPFFFFILDWKKREELKGRVFSNGLKDVQADPDCNIEWQSLSKESKHIYEIMAKKDKIASQISISKKTITGEPIQLLEKREMEEKKFIADMNEFLKSTIARGVTHNILPELKFCFVHVNWFFEKLLDNTVDYFPAEYAVGVFSLENGIEDIHHEIVNAQIPLGYRREALETSQNTHNIPIEHGEESNFAVMYEKLINFLEPRKIVHKYPPLYTTKGSYKGAVQSLLKKLCDAAQQDVEKFLVYEIESLFKNLADEVYKKRADRDVKYTPIYAEGVFKNCKHTYKRGYECIFHKYVESGSEYCSKSILHKWAWNMCEEFCEPLEIDMKPGIHLPENSINSHSHAMGEAMAHLNINSETSQATSEQYQLLSMTGVSEQHRIKVSELTHIEKMRRRMQVEPIVVVDHSKLNQQTDRSIESQKKPNMLDYLQKKPIRPPNTKSYVAATMDDNVLKNDERNFPPIGGRGILLKIKDKTKTQLLGKGHGNTNM